MHGVATLDVWVSIESYRSHPRARGSIVANIVAGELVEVLFLVVLTIVKIFVDPGGSG